MRTLVCVFVTLMISLQAISQPVLKATELNVFKNGTYFIAKEGAADASGGKWEFPAPTSPLLSTFWLTTTKDNKVTRIEFDTDTLKQSRSCLTLQDFMFANKGTQVTITYSVGDKEVRSLTGSLVNFVKETGVATILDDSGKYYFINTSGVVEFSTPNTKSPATKMQVDSLVRFAKVYFNKSSGDIPVRLSYMHTGINWVPSYNIKVMDDKQLQLEMKALVENYSEAMENVDMTLTVGSPQFKYGSAIDPLALNYLNNMNNQERTFVTQVPAMYDNAIAANQMMEKKNEVYEDFSSYATEGEKTNDLYMYKLGKISMPKNSKTSFSIFSAAVPYEDIYEVNIYDVVSYANNYQITNDPEQTFDVFHSFKLTNNTSFPFTTAPVFVQDEKLKPLAQDQVKYTPTNGKVKVQLSKSPDVVVKNKEMETARVENAKTINKQVYRKVTIKGTIEVENAQGKAITLNVTKTVAGNVKEASDGGTITKSGRYQGLNPNSQVEWDVKLAAGEKKSITYEYEVYVYGG